MKPLDAGPCRLVSIQVGLPRDMDVDHAADQPGAPWRSAIVKEAVLNPVLLMRTGLEGDGQADTENHGGSDRAVLAYSADCYHSWREELGLPKLGFGAFGENFTVSHVSEDTVCMGDTFRLGQVVVQVSQPRQPCWKLERRIGYPGLVERVLATGRTGWYLRVLEEGPVKPGLAMELLDRPHPEWTVTRAHEIARRRHQDHEAASALADCPFLAAGWQSMLRGA